MRKSGLYIHIPFCSRKCLYCDFYSAGSRIADWELYVSALLKELKIRKKELSLPPATLYLGGGTPSLISPKAFRLLMDGVRNEIGNLSDCEEFTIEVNPDDVTPEKCKLWKEEGVSRVSLGIQSLDDKELKLIGRRHSSEDAIKAFDILSEFFDNISVDLMFGLPEQTLSSWEKTVEETLRLKPSHISSYSLMKEPGTALTVLNGQGKLNLPSEEVTLEMWRRLSMLLEKDGYQQYEISNYSLPGRESRHNMLYWSGLPYLGLGPSACSYDGGTGRQSNPADIKKYLSYYSQTETVNNDKVENKSGAVMNSWPLIEKEVLTSTELKTEMIMTRLRKMEGLDLAEYRERFGEVSLKKLIEKAKFFIGNGTLSIDGDRLKLTKEGIMVSDSVFVGLME